VMAEQCRSKQTDTMTTSSMISGTQAPGEY
jgi:hypothetical protein